MKCLKHKKTGRGQEDETKKGLKEGSSGSTVFPLGASEALCRERTRSFRVESLILRFSTFLHGVDVLLRFSRQQDSCCSLLGHICRCRRQQNRAFESENLVSYCLSNHQKNSRLHPKHAPNLHNFHPTCPANPTIYYKTLQLLLYVDNNSCKSVFSFILN